MASLLVISSILASASIETPPASCADLRPTVAAIASALESRYVLAAPGIEGGARLRAMSRRGDLSRVCGSGAEQAAVLSRATRAALNDLHLRVIFGPAELTDPPEHADADALADNLGIEDVGRMPGGIGYLRISGWAPVSWVEPRLANAFALLRDSTALIIDVRGNPGGDGSTVDLVARTFLPVGSPPTLQELDRAGKPSRADRGREPTWPRFPRAMPVAVLIDRESASGSESLAFSLREEKRATIIGSRSAGAAHALRDAVALPGGFSLYIPQYRKEGRLSHTDWEGVGVRPDVETGSVDAKMLAWEFLRQKLAETRK